MDNQNFNPVPPVEPKKTKGVKGLVIAIVAIVVALVSVAGVAAFVVVSNTPEARLAKGFAKWAEKDGDETFAEGVLGLDAILDAMMYGATKKDMSLNVTIPALEIPTIGIDMTDRCDYPNQKDVSDWEVSVSNIELIRMQMAADSDKLYLSIPTLLDDTYHIGYEGFTDNFNNSEWSDMLELVLEEEVQINPWTMQGTQEEDAGAEIIFSEEFMNAFEAKIAEISKNMTVQKSDLPFEIVRNNKTFSCDEIGVVVPKDDLNALLDLIQEEMRNGKLGAEMIKALQANGAEDVQELWEQVVALFDSRVEEDFDVYFYLDKKNNILTMSTGRLAMDNGIIMSLSLDYMGEEDPAMIVGGTYYVKEKEGASFHVDFTNEHKTEGTKESTQLKMDFEVIEYDSEPMVANMDVETSWDNETYEFSMSIDMDEEEESLFGFIVEGRFADITTGESFTLELGKCILNTEGYNIVKVTGDYTVMPLTEEVKAPAASVDLFGMTQMDIQMMLFEIIGNVGNMEDALNELNF